MTNIRKRKDGRYEWRKQIDNVSYQKINKNKKELERQVKAILNRTKTKLIMPSKVKFIDLAIEWYNLYKKDIKSGERYLSIINNKLKPVSIFNKDIRDIQYHEIEIFLNKMNEHRSASYCYFTITGVFKEAYKRDLIQKNIAELINKPKNKTVKGTQFTFEEQKLILSNLDKTPIKNEILFYLMTGCRRNEAFDIKINYEKLNIYINGSKTKQAQRYVPISLKYAEYLKNNVENMFKHKEHYYNQEFKKYMEMLGISGKTIHTLRHTYSTNLYYLGVKDKERQYYLGHSSIVITNDIYTHLEPNLTSEDILNLYKDLYPKF